MSRQRWEQMMDRLELQTSMDPIQPRGAIDIHGRAQLLHGPRLVAARCDGRHGEVREGELHMQRHGDHVRDHKEEEALCPGRDRAPHDQVAEPEPEEDLAGKLVETVPAVGFWALVHEDEF